MATAQARGDAQAARRSANAAGADAAIAGRSATKAEADAAVARTAASQADKDAAAARGWADKAEAAATLAEQHAAHADQVATEAVNAAVRAEAAQRREQEGAQAKQSLDKLRESLLALRNAADNAGQDNPAMAAVKQEIDRLLAMLAQLGVASADYVREHLGELLALLGHLFQTAGGAGLALAGAVTTAEGLAVCGEEIAAGAGIGAGVGAAGAGIGALPGGVIGGLGGLVACVFTGGPAVAGGIAEIAAGMAAASDGITKAADDIKKLNKRGNIDESAKTFSPKERGIAEKLASEGKNVKALKESPDRKVRTPDALVDGKPVEFKTLDAGNDNTVKNLLDKSAKGGGQARDIILDSCGVELTQDAGRLGIKRRLGNNSGHYDSIRIIGRDFDFTWRP
ncbi:hypothetical protein [Amycolatopsis sp. lyj-108]|uniref:CdiA C-terminal domain-containing protein n=1 Tax=Amycolatopsis sp. lyj-108 TaxID=2789286 RepID=UPI00397CB3C6